MLLSGPGAGQVLKSINPTRPLAPTVPRRGMTAARPTFQTGTFAQSNLPSAVSNNQFNAANEMTSFNGTALTYDGNDNLTNDGTNTYGRATAPARATRYLPRTSAIT
jgi:hypothetical protein